MSGYVFKVSLPGYDVRTATPEQCSVHSSYPPLKAKMNQSEPHFGTLDVDFTAGITQNLTQTVYTVNHNYGYIPLNFASIVFNSSTLGGVPVVGVGIAGIGATLAIEAYCTTTQFIVTIYDNFNWVNASSSLQVSYYVFAENGT